MRPGRGAPATSGPGGDAGMVTAELAVALPSLLVVVGASLALIGAVGVQMRCTDAAATAARLVARGESSDAARDAAATMVGRAADVRISTAGGSVRVVVRTSVTLPGLGHLLHLPSVSAEFSQPVEPGVGR
jgi:Flp pilus assembly protein TadG